MKSLITKDNYVFLESLVSKLALKDYKQANPKKRKKHRPYSLSLDTLEALDVLHIAQKQFMHGKILTRAEIEEVKHFILSHKLFGEL